MNKKFLSILLTLVLALSLCLVTAGPVAAATPIYVNGATGNDSWDGTSPTYVSELIGPKQTIQAGINVVDAGGTVNVATGTYADIDIVDKSLTLQGEGNPTIDGGGIAWGTIFVMGHVAEAVTIDGFEIINSDIDGIHNQENSLTVLTITDNTIRNNNRDGISLHGFWNQPSSDGNTISGNTIYGNVGNGIVLEWSNSNTVTENDCYSNGKSGIYLWSSCSNIITYNDLHENDWLGVDIGEWVGSEEAGTPTSGNQINYNSIWGNLGLDTNGLTGLSYSVDSFNLTPETVDATSNWWGDVSGPDDDAGVINGSGAGISLNVDADPWAINQTCTEFASAPPGAVVGLTTEGPAAAVGISVLPTSINFGTVSVAEEIVPGDTLAVTNIGNVAINVSAELTADAVCGDGNFYADGLFLNELLSTEGVWDSSILGISPMAVGTPPGNVPTKLVVPTGITVGTTYEGTVAFWAEMAD